MATPAKAWKPHGDDLPLHVVRFSGAVYHEGVESNQVWRVVIPVYGPAKTLADYFTYPN